jgi:hypothetical protein
MTPEELSNLIASGVHVTMEVHALESTVYVAYRLDGERRVPIATPSGRTVQFPSRYAAQVALRDAGVSEATFIHRSAYGEMIGMDSEGQNTELRETVSFTHV